ncbi:hypothetical protein BUALT_Bualt05G0136500 [Buddleja alternifolia]|uniref:F-box domain-containing protein n=1 Tax=Buddleja alternifolia TaxID=168488 RepID=A0AAV6XSD4_9LAMI|nr:hypothetical protein BUALT_Bualt05G0136500 [Buddleja alternifolia]
MKRKSPPSVTMKTTKRPAAVFDKSPPLPEEIIFFELFARLPIKSLLRFRCVSKFCRSLTSDPHFLAAHCGLSPPRYLLSFSSSLLSYQHVFHCLNPNNCVKSQSELNEYYRNHRSDSYAKSINGLMCLLRGNKVEIRNLGTKKEFVLPHFHSQFELDKHYVYFCHDPKTDKYKVLIATSERLIGVNRDFNVVSMRYSILTLGVDKAWRGFDQPGLHQLGQSKSICVDGVLYCTNFSTTSEVENGIIATFDVGSENFSAITYPEELPPSRETDPPPSLKNRRRYRERLSSSKSSSDYRSNHSSGSVAFPNSAALSHLIGNSSTPTAAFLRCATSYRAHPCYRGIAFSAI